MTRYADAGYLALAACVGVLCAGVPLLPVNALIAIALAAAFGYACHPEERPQVASRRAMIGACIAFAAAIAQRPEADWKVVVGIALGALATTRWFAAAVVAATLLFFFG